MKKPLSISFFWDFFFIKTTFARLFVTLFICGGLIAWFTMSRENYPDLDIPQALIKTEWQVASAEQIEKEISQKLEKALRTVDGVKHISSASFDGYSIISIDFNANLNVDKANNALREKIDETLYDLPSEAKKPTITRMSVNNIPVIGFMLFGHGDVHEEQLQAIARALKKDLEQTPGIRAANILGERETTVYIRLYPEKIRALHLSPLQIKQRIQQANHDLSWGNLENTTDHIQLRFQGRFTSLDDIKNLDIMRIAQSHTIRLKDIADVQIQLEKTKIMTSFSYNGSDFQHGVGLDVMKIAGEDTLSVVAKAIQVVEQAKLKPYWYHGVNVKIVNNQSNIINQSFSDVTSSIWQAMLAVFCILLLLLTWREALFSGFAIPITLLSSLMMLMLFGYTLNSIIIIGMVLSLGILVDVFIIVLEGIHRGLFNDKLSFTETAIRTVKLYARPALAGQLTTIFALIPLLMIGGIDGKFIRLIPITMIIILITSFLIAFFICIPLSQYLYPKHKQAKASYTDRIFDQLAQYFETWLINVPLSNRRTALMWIISPIVLLFLVLKASSLLPVEMYPPSDGRNLGIFIELSPHTPLNKTHLIAQQGEAFLKTLTYLESITSITGSKSRFSVVSIKDAILPLASSNYIGYSVIFKPKHEREKLAFAYLDEIRQGLEHQFKDIADIHISTFLDSVGGNYEAPIQIIIAGEEINQLAKFANQVKSILNQIPGTHDVMDNLGTFKTQIRFTPIPHALSQHQISEDNIIQQIRLATSFDEISLLKQAGTQDDTKIRLGTYWANQQNKITGISNASELATLQIITPKGERIPLGALVTMDFVSTPLAFVHHNGTRAVTIKASVTGRTAQEVIDDLRPFLINFQKEWPSNYHYTLDGEVSKSQESFAMVGLAFILALILIFSTLVLIFNNFTQPFIVLITVPLGLIGTFGGFFLAGIPLSFTGMIGIVSLIGIVVNNAIVMVETINYYSATGQNIKKTIAYRAAERLRPIIGTTLTTVVGLIPLALSAPIWYPLAMAIILGLLFSTIVSLILVPALYWLLQGNKETFS